MSRFDFLVETYRTERLKTLAVWSQVPGLNPVRDRRSSTWFTSASAKTSGCGRCSALP
jgi:hypothetical protein